MGTALALSLAGFREKLRTIDREANSSKRARLELQCVRSRVFRELECPVTQIKRQALSARFASCIVRIDIKDLHLVMTSKLP